MEIAWVSGFRRFRGLWVVIFKFSKVSRVWSRLVWGQVLGNVGIIWDSVLMTWATSVKSQREFGTFKKFWKRFCDLVSFL